MIELTEHLVEPQEPHASVRVAGEPNSIGVHSEYSISINKREYFNIVFQTGNQKEVGINGITNEILLNIVLHRLQEFQASAFDCDENSIAINDIKSALDILKQRTSTRIARGVEGKQIV